MDAEFLETVERNWREAYYAESRSEYAEALRLYRLVSGAGAMISATEKDGLRIEFGKLSEKIAELVSLVGAESGHGKVKHIPFEKVRVSATRSTVYDSEGYQWG